MLGPRNFAPANSGLGNSFPSTATTSSGHSTRGRPGPLCERFRLLGPGRFDSCQVQFRTRSVISVVGWHFVQGAPFAIATAPGADLSDRLIARVPSEVATLPSSGRLLSDPLPNLALLLRLEVHKGGEGDAPEYSSRRSATSHTSLSVDGEPRHRFLYSVEAVARTRSR